MAGENLIYTFGGDASKLFAEIERIKLQLGGVRKAAKDAFKKGDTAGVAEYTNQIGNLQSNLRGLNRTLNETGDVAAKTSGRIALSARSFRSLEQAVFGFGKTVAGAQAGMVAFAAFRLGSELKGQIDEVRKRIEAIRDLSRETAQKPGAVKAAQDAATSVGNAATDADKALSTMAATLAKVRTEAGSPLSGAQVLTQGTFRDDRGVDVIRGAQRAVFDLSKSYEMLGINLRAYNGTQEDTIRKQLEMMAAFKRAADSGRFDPVRLNEISKQWFGVPAETMLEMIPALTEKLRKAAEENKKIQADIAQNKALKAAWDEVRVITDGILEEQNRLLTGLETRFAKWIAASLRESQRLQKELQQSQKNAPANPFGDPSIPAMPTTVEGPGGPGQAAVALIPPVRDLSTATKDNSAATREATKATQAAANSNQAAAAATQDAVRRLPTVGYGGTGFPSPYGPPSGGYGYGPRGSAYGETSSPERGGDPREKGTSPYLQSYAPGMSNYQALPPDAVRPMEESAAQGWGMAETAAEQMANAAKASKDAAEASRLAADGWVQVSRSVGYADGGYISGPGTGTSDSIAARLSNGEFVMRAAAVNRWGAGFMAQLNALRNPFAGFAAGGLVGRRFADGGLVKAGAGGTPVHLHLGGHSFALSGAGSVVDALVVEANRQHVRSAGVKPSWYGGRPGGR